MLKVVCVVDKVGTALDRLAKGVAKYHDNLDYIVVDVHPKRPSPEQLEAFVKAAQDADIMDWQYFKTAEMLRGKYEWLKDKKHILTHNNPYSIEDSDWNAYDLNTGNNQYIYKRLGEITQTPVEYVPLTVDTDFWIFNTDSYFNNNWDNWEANNRVIMVANRIEGKKGILPVAIACGELNLRLVLVGAISDRDYYEAILQTGVVEFHEQVSDEELRELYYSSTLHVCNSGDNFESGTLPLLEAMLCGVPVMTRKIGHVPELYNGENMALYEGDNEDVPALVARMEEVLADKKALRDMRERAWQTAKSRSHERRAYLYQKLYRQVLHGTEKPVSVVVPVYDKPEVIRECLNAVAGQTYKNIELVVCDDFPVGLDPYKGNQQVVREFARTVCFPVLYTNKGDGEYGLARARNIGTIEATGDIIVYCDQRMIMEPDAIEEFVRHIKPKYWLYGNKGAKKEFVENFSCVYREDVIHAGMFCERMDAYGGMSQEIRSRIRAQGIQIEYVESAKANPRGKSSNRNRKRQEIIKMKNRLFKMGLE